MSNAEDKSGPQRYDPLEFIRNCIRDGAVFWTYHVNMRLRMRSLNRLEIVQAVDTFEIIERYPDDKYMPSYLIYFELGKQPHHAVIATDSGGPNIRIVTVYKPDAGKWSSDFKRRLST